MYVGFTVTVAYWLRLGMQLKPISVKGGIAASEYIPVLRGPILVAALMAIPNTYFVAAALMAIPNIPFVADDSSMLKIEILSLSVKCIIFLLLFKLFPRFFFCSAAVDVLDRFAIGRRIIRALGT
jgi:hypothetical protein